MAIIKVGAPLSGIRGTIGGVVYSANGAAAYAKEWAPPSNPRSSKQSTQRRNLSEIPALWTALTAAEKAAWDTFAALGAQALTNSLGETYYASGFNWFTKCNTRLARLGISPITATPTQARPAAPTIEAFRVTVGGSDPTVIAGGTPSASSSNILGQPASAFDDDPDTYWFTAGPTTPTGWLRYDFAAAKNIKHYSVQSSGDAPALSAMKSWYFQCYADSAWQVLHTVTDNVVGNSPEHFYVENPYDATRYRLNITANAGNADYLHCAEFAMYLGDEEASVITYPEDEYDAATEYDLVLHIGQAATTGRQALYHNFREIVVNDAPDRWQQLFQAELETTFGAIATNRGWFARLYRQTEEGIRSAAATAYSETIS